jgi:hypothetical protein
VDRSKTLRLILIFALFDAIFLRWVWLHFDNWGFWDWDYQQSLLEIARVSVTQYGQVPLWNPYLGGGVSYAGNTLNHVWAPSFIPILLLGTLPGIKICILLYLGIAQWGMFQLARSREHDPWTASFAAAIYSFGGVYAQRLTHGHFEWIAIAWVPLVILGIDRCSPQIRRRPLWLAGIFFGFIFLDGGPYQFAFFGIFAGIYAIAKSLETRSTGPLIALVAISSIAIALSAIKLLPVFELIARFPRPTTEEAFYGAPFIPGILEILHQMFVSRSQVHDASLWMPYILNVGTYVGWIPLLLSAVALRADFRRHIVLLACGLTSLWIALGSSAPIDLWHYLHQLPGLSMLRVASRFNVYALLCVALLSAAGFDQLRERLPDRSWAKGALVVMGLVTIGDLIYLNGQVFKVAFSIPPLDVAASAPFRQYYAYSPFIERYQQAALYPVHPNWPSGNFPAVLENRGVRWAFKTLPFSSFALSSEDAGYRGESWMNTGSGKITETQWTPNRVRVETDGGGGMLMLNINYDPGWREIGKSNATLVDNSGIIGIDVPTGTREIEIAYRPNSFYWGATISATTASAAALCLLAATRPGRKRTDFDP